MSRAGFRAGLLLAAFAAVSSLTQAAAGDAPQPELQNLGSRTLYLRSLQEADGALEVLHKLAWVLPEGVGPQAVDSAGNSLSKDMSEIVLREDVVAAIAAARATAEQTLAEDSQADPVTVLQPMAKLLVGEMIRVNLLGMAWQMLPDFQRTHMGLIDPLLDRLPESDRAAYRQRLPDIDTLIAQARQLAAAPDVPALLNPASPLMQAVNGAGDTYNQMREELAQRRMDEKAASPDAPWHERSSACPEPVEPKSSDAGLSVRRSADVGTFYPPQMQRHGVSGLVRVELTVSSSGCVTQVRVAESSGAAELDAAAEQVAFATELFPASKNGQAVEVRVILPVRFSFMPPPPE
ncbi:MAG: energy transducer TonB [Nevskiaceae bacterium]|jgi:TonB family protein|nr:energy transducer TonB [Nevskiaceae bacterium]